MNDAFLLVPANVCVWTTVLFVSVFLGAILAPQTVLLSMHHLFSLGFPYLMFWLVKYWFTRRVISSHTTPVCLFWMKSGAVVTSVLCMYTHYFLEPCPYLPWWHLYERFNTSGVCGSSIPRTPLPPECPRHTRQSKVLVFSVMSWNQQWRSGAFSCCQGSGTGEVGCMSTCVFRSSASTAAHVVP